MKKICLFAAIVAAVQISSGQSPTWAADIAPLTYAKCTKCHHDGGLGKFSLIGYSETYAKRFLITNAISLGEMPPWPPDPSYRHFKDENLLTQTQVALINAWVTNGAPSGDTTTAPAPPIYSNTSQLTQVNKVLQMPTFTVPANVNYDLYQCFVLPTNLSQEEFITAIEVVPGNPEIVHHVLIYEDTSSNHAARLLDNQTPSEPGYVGFGGPGVPAQLVGGWVPGTRPEEYPTGMGVKLHPNSDLIMQVHFPAGSAGKTDSSKIYLRLNTGALRAISIAPPINHSQNLINGPLVIPANSTKTFESRYTIPSNIPLFQGISVLNIAPHAHLICTDWLVFAKTPQGDTIPLIKINNWDFHWQGFYTVQKLIHLTPGTTLYGFATYDNTANNPHNPSSPPQTITVGESTTDEMMLCYFSYMIYQNGDENKIIDSSILNQPSGVVDFNESGALVSTPQLYEPIPNPAVNSSTISYYLPRSVAASISVYDMNGKLLKRVDQSESVGFQSVDLLTTDLPSGNVLISMEAGGITKTKQLVVQH